MLIKFLNGRNQRRLIAFLIMMISSMPLYAEEKIKSLTSVKPIVVELFTSEGCSSCPPADSYMGELAKRTDLLPLTFHVDYWDYIGWKDRFADPAYTQRQRYYANVFGSHTVYTPQMVIGGALDVVGSDKESVTQALDTVKTRLTTYDIVLEKDGNALMANFPEAPINGIASVWLVAYQKEGASQASAGENAGRKLHTFNVVRQMMMVGKWEGNAMQIVLPKLDPAQDIDGLAIIANLNQTGQIVAATAFAPN